MELIRLLTKVAVIRFYALFLSTIVIVNCEHSTLTLPTSTLGFHVLEKRLDSLQSNPGVLDGPNTENLIDGPPATGNLEDKSQLAIEPEEGGSSDLNGYRSNNSLLYEAQHADQSRFIKPIHYRIQVRPIFDPADNNDNERFTIPGSVQIWIQCFKETNLVILNSKLIKVDDTSLKVANSDPRRKYIAKSQITVKSTTVDESNHEYIIELVDNLQSGNIYVISLSYIGQVFTDRLNGIYLSNYTVPSTNETEYLVVTQFEPTGARQAFPCFDYPNQKATFDISIGRREKYRSLCNMELAITEPIESLPGWYWDHYRTTVKMSTYLIALVVSEFTSETAPPAVYVKPVKIWACKHFIDDGAGVFAANTVGKVLSFYETFFDAEYPLAKMDSAAIPHFSAGAMENYGLNTYRTYLLLYYPNNSTERDRQNVASVIGHEVGHQWWGNYVTCRSFSQIFLNEGFAAFVEYLGVDAIYPEFQIWSQFTSGTLQRAFLTDQNAELTHPLVNETIVNVGNFDTITYQKGASLIRMMQDFLGHLVFQKGLQTYLKKFAFGNAHHTDLFSTLNEVANLYDEPSLFKTSEVGLQEIMDSWTLQSGVLVVKVGIESADSLYLTQEKFCSAGPNEDDDSKQGWWIPVKVKEGVNADANVKGFWMSNDRRMVLFSGVDTTESLFLVNPDSIGYYRVLYDDELTKRILRQLDENCLLLTSSAKSQLIDDNFNAAFAKYILIDQALDFTLYLEQETEYNVWATTMTNFKKIFRLLRKTESYEKLRSYLATRVNSALKLLGYEQRFDEKGLTVITRSRLFDFAIFLEDEEFLEYCRKLFADWKVDPVKNRIPADLEDTVFCGVLKLGGKDDWNFLSLQFTDGNCGEFTRRRLQNALLRCTQEPESLKRILEDHTKFISAETKSDTLKNYKKLTSNTNAHDLLLEFVQKSLMKETTSITSEYGHFDEFVKSVISSLSYYLQSDEDLGKMQNMVNMQKESNSSVESNLALKNLESSIKRIKENRDWMNDFYKRISDWLTKHS